MSTPERLAYWYLRLNGFLTIENFVVHPDQGTNQRTDADLLAVRFLHRAENRQSPMVDDPKCSDCDAIVNVIIAEVKTGACALNGPWTRPEDENIQRVLSAIGCLGPDEIEVAAQALYDKATYRGEVAQLRLMAFGDRQGELPIPATPILFDEMIDFIWKRLKDFDRQKKSIGNWSEDGRAIRNEFDTHRNERSTFAEALRNHFGLPRRNISTP